jgi:hypothetical protein
MIYTFLYNNNDSNYYFEPELATIGITSTPLHNNLKNKYHTSGI